jgi:hypothetical protein
LQINTFGLRDLDMDFQGTVPPGISPNNQSPISKASDETNQMPPLVGHGYGFPQ